MNEAELLLAEILSCNRMSLCLEKNRVLDKRESALISRVLRRRIKGEPIQYILGRLEFMGFEFRVTPDVFIPRPETEILVQAALKVTKSISISHKVTRILDIGTGSGCIAVSLAKYLPSSNLTASDISQEAINIAKKNAQIHNVADKITFLKSNLFTNYELRITNYDLIISNPPYIPTAEISNLEPELGYEPRIALDGGRDGLIFYRRIIQEAPTCLRKDGFLILEMGFNQCSAIKKLFSSVDKFEISEVVKDYQNIDRVIVARLR